MPRWRGVRRCIEPPLRWPFDLWPFDLGNSVIQSRFPRPWLAVHLALLAAAAAVLVRANRGQWFFGDEWDFLVNRGLFGAPLSLWVPHNEHWSTLPILVFVALRNTVGLASYWPYICVLIVVHLALTHVLWRVMLRSGALPAVATSAAALFSVLGAGSENLLWAFQIGFIGSVALGWAAALVAATPDRRPVRRDLWALLLLIGSLMCSGIGVPMVVVAAVAVWVSSRAVWRPLLVGGAPALVFAIWYETVGRVPKAPGTGAHGVRQILDVMARGVGHIVSVSLGVPRLIAVIVLIAVGSWCLWAVAGAIRGRPDAAALGLALAGVTGIVAFGLMVAVGRGDLKSSRYVYVIVAMGLPAVALALTVVCRWKWVQAVAAIAVLWAGVHNGLLLRQDAANQRVREAWTRDVIQSAANLVESGAPTVGSQPEPVFDPNITTQSLRIFVERNGLSTAASDRGTLGARLALQVAALPPGVGPSAAPALVKSSSGVSSVDGAGGCVAPNPGAPGALVVGIDGRARSLLLRAADTGASYVIGIGSGPSAPPVLTIAVPKGELKDLVMVLPSGVPDVTIWPVTPASVVCMVP